MPSPRGEEVMRRAGFLWAELDLHVCTGRQGCGQACVRVAEGVGQTPHVHAGGGQGGGVCLQWKGCHYGCNVGCEQVKQTPGAPTGVTRGSDASAQDPPSQHPSLSPGQSLRKAADPAGPADGVWDPQTGGSR